MTDRSSKSAPVSFDHQQFDWRVLMVLWLVPLVAYLWLIGRWSLSGDEYYTLVDSSKPVFELLSYERKPLYYLICHVLLQFDLGLPVETVIRLPAAIAASLIPPTFYVMLSNKRFANIGLLASVIALFSPWLFQMAQYARFYSLAFLFATITALAGLRCLHAPSKKRWLILMLVAGAFATISQIPAGLVLPAALVGLGLAAFRENPVHASAKLKKYAPILIGAIIICGLGGMIALKDVFQYWLSSDAGSFGTYTIPQIFMALAIGAGITTWGLALLPLARPPLSWSSSDIYMTTTVMLSGFPLLVFIPFGGGVASNYLMFCMPCLFVLAASHWRQIDERLPSWGYRIAMGCGVVAFNLPYLASVYSNGDHYDVREAAARVDAMQLDNPVIVSSGHALLNHYLETASSEFELSTFEAGVARHLVQEGIDVAKAEDRPLLLVARQNRGLLSPEDQQWLYSQFALVATIKKSRFDHRRHQMTIFEYRPSPFSEECKPLGDGETPAMKSRESKVEREAELAAP